MSKPANPLDVYVTYTYHFELHAATSWDKLKELETRDDNATTSAFEPKGTLLINTRKDAHQVIDDVRYTATADAGSQGDILTPSGLISMTVTEPGGFAFIEKLNALRQDNKVSEISTSLCFVLKIMFVGRYADNTVKTITAKLIPMILSPDMSATFSELGGKYTMLFTPAAMAGSANDITGPMGNFGYTKRGISFKARTIEEALSSLEKKLNEGYSGVYKDEATTEGRPIVYKITYDPEIKGAIESTNKDSNAPGEKSSFTFKTSVQIGSFISQILKASPTLQQKVGRSIDGLKEEGHPDVFIPLIQPRVLYNDDQVLVNYHIAVNRGGIQNTWEFDYFFADAGKNVDITSYEVKLNNIGAWTPFKTEVGYDLAFNQSATVPAGRPAIYSENIVTPDTTRQANRVDVQKSTPGFKQNDVRVLPPVTNDDRSGYINTPYSATPTLRMASDARRDFMTAVNFSQQIEIRGNIDFLNASAYYPDGLVIGDLLGGKNIWVKINIWMVDPRYPGGKRPFYYTGKYKVITIENVFTNGQFKQHLFITAAENT